MEAGGAVGGSGRDLVVVALPLVQRFITEARTTSDVAVASVIYSALAREIAGVFINSPGMELVLPAAGGHNGEAANLPPESGMPNRVVALCPEGEGEAAAARASAAVHEAWRSWVRKALGRPAAGPVPMTPGFPLVQWVSVPPNLDGYEAQWDKAQRLLAARRRLRDFAPVPEDEWRRRALCSLAPRWPAEPQAPPGTPRHDREARLSVVGWVKRSWRRVHHDDGFPSTASIASAPYRQAILRSLDDENVAEALAALAKAARVIDAPPETPVPGLRELIPATGPGHWLGVAGPWVYPERWQPASLARDTEITDQARLAEAAEAGAKAARGLHGVMARRGVPLASYLAVLVQDVDSMGRFLGGGAPNAEGGKITVIPNEHRRLSQVLITLAAGQCAALRDAAVLGVPVYAGGDDLLAFTPAATALRAAEESNQAIPPSLPTASTAVLFFHYHASIQQAMSTARRLLDEAKANVPGKHALAVGYLRRSGASEASIQPWAGRDGESAAALFRIFARDAEYRLSPRLVADLERDAVELAGLRDASERLHRGELYLGELARLVRRHTGTRRNRDSGESVSRAPSQAARSASEVATALAWLGRHECAWDEGAGEVPGPHRAAKIGVFLRQEAVAVPDGDSRGRQG